MGWFILALILGPLIAWLMLLDSVDRRHERFGAGRHKARRYQPTDEHDAFRHRRYMEKHWPEK